MNIVGPPRRRGIYYTLKKGRFVYPKIKPQQTITTSAKIQRQKKGREQ